ncbi:peptide/nickel transport system ATP-binding protein [Micromonospora pattaloongensis]|uniref:Peptide/nickel transport system ATP-binding protein n=1 Tax=Micromonospora pattaloongensis TaxID=405436 RepID=A0A1H3JTM6_9ACTN|nr:ATP-binding cassette domain-containing protein [Micromonospora pattaloongensis]SDY42718.1 peptide/nickel transport system ATP-binding protein [Micromonospora pattaloongensis]
MNMHVQGLVVTHTGRTLLDVDDLRLERGRAVTIVGESGSGKSLLAHAVMGTLGAGLEAQGRVVIEGTSYDVAERRARRRLWGRVMALLPQEPVLALDPTMRVRGQVAEGAASFWSDRRSGYRAAEEVLGTLGVAGAARRYPHTLSGGMAQRVAFAAATIGGARVLIADEPSKGLDDHARNDLTVLLHRHVTAGGILLTITHDLDLGRDLGGDVLVMRDAGIVERGPAHQVLITPSHPYTRRLLAAEPGRWRHLWVRDRTSGATERTADPGGPTLVQTDRVAKGFAGRTLFSDVSLTIRPGDRLALAGPSGSGKTTLGNVLLRLLQPDAGSVRHTQELAGGRLQKLYQDPAVAFPSRVPIGAALADVVRRHRPAPGRLTSLLAAMRLDESLLQRTPGQVSGGELQRLSIIRAILVDPLLIFADEPTSRLDLVTQEETMCCLMEQVERSGCALVLVTHNQALAHTVADRVLAVAG